MRFLLVFILCFCFCGEVLSEQEKQSKEVIQETAVIEYVLDKVNAYIEVTEWYEEDYEARVKDLQAIVVEYGYPESNHYIEVLAAIDPINGSLVYIDINVTLHYKVDKDIRYVSTWRIFFEIIEEQNYDGGV